MDSHETIEQHHSWEDDPMEDPPYDHHHHHQESHSHSLSRLATCTSNPMFYYDTMLSRLSIESFDADGDADEEFSDGNYGGGGGGGGPEESSKGCLSSDFDDDKGPAAACYSLPATPLQQQRYQSDVLFGKLIGSYQTKQYASDNDAQKLIMGRRGRRERSRIRTRRRRERLSRRERETAEASNWDHIIATTAASGKKEGEEEMDGGERGWSQFHNNNNSFSGESEGGGLRVMTRPKGGKRSLCMDIEEVKACRDLGFELEHEGMFDMTAMPSRLTVSTSTLDTTTTSSGGSSPIPNWRISSPGDDPRDVKARLKVWAQAVAIASTSRQGSSSS